MNLHQFRFVQEAVRRNLNLTEAAKALHTSQPGVSKAIIELEDELGIDIFTRHGKRIKRITEPGQHVLKSIEIIMREVNNLKRIGEQFSAQDNGTLSIATTHTQARYVLPDVIRRFMQRYPQVKLELHQGNPRQVCDMVLDGTADIAIATEAIAEYDDLVMLPCYQWNRCVVATPRHPILKASPLTLEEIARYPLITYDDAFTGRGQINKAFLGRGLKPRVVLSAIDSDVIKKYVEMDLGIGILARMAYDPAEDRKLGMIDAAHLFESSTTRIGLRKRAWLRAYVYAFIEGFAPHLSRRMVELALAGGGTDPGL